MPLQPDALQDDAIAAMLPFVPNLGWGKAALRAAYAERGETPDAELLFPGGPEEMVEAFLDLSLRRALVAAEPRTAGEMRLGKRVRGVVQALLMTLEMDREATRRAAAWMLRPSLGPRLMAGLVDRIWYAAEDRAADFSWYTKRASLAAILLPTFLFWLHDPAGDTAASLDFFDRKLAGLGRAGRARARLTSCVSELRGPLGRLRAASGRISQGHAT
jgi:ubiquinone biosynthesis protein COQ9